MGVQVKGRGSGNFMLKTEKIENKAGKTVRQGGKKVKDGIRNEIN